MASDNFDSRYYSVANFESDQEQKLRNMEKCKEPEEEFKPALFVINLHSTSRYYYCGSTIEGTVVLELTHPRNTPGIMIVLRGESYVYWTGWENTIRGRGVYQKWSNARCGSSNKIINDLVVQLFGNNRTVDYIGAGRHEFPFRLQVPSDTTLPSSYTYDRPTSGSPTGCIKYTLEASFFQSQDVTYTTQVEIPVNEIANTNLPYLASPLSLSKTKSGCLLCCNIGPVSLSVKTNQGGYYPGDSILISLEARNNSSRRITAVQAVLKQKVIFHGYHIRNTHYSHYTGWQGRQRARMDHIPEIPVYTCKKKVMQMIEDFDVRTSREIYNWVDKPLLIPVTDPTVAQTITTCKNLEVSYELTVSLIIRHARNLSVKLPIIIGNVPPNY